MTIVHLVFAVYADILQKHINPKKKFRALYHTYIHNNYADHLESWVTLYKILHLNVNLSASFIA